MASSLRVLEDVEPRVAALRFEDELSHVDARAVDVELSDSALRRGIWALPVLDAVARRFPSAERRVRGRPEVAALLGSHLGWRAAAAGDLRADLVVDLSPSTARAARFDRGRPARLHVPSRPFPRRRQHTYAHWIDGAVGSGLPATEGAPALRLARGAVTSARELAATLFGRWSGPLVAVLPIADGGWGVTRFEAALARLCDRIGAVGVSVGPEVPGARPLPDVHPSVAAAFLGLCGVTIADDGGWGHVAAAAGAPVVMIHGDTSPEQTGPASERGAAIWAAAGGCHRCRVQTKPRCLACVAPRRIAEVAEALAAERWPWDRVARVVS